MDLSFDTKMPFPRLLQVLPLWFWPCPPGLPQFHHGNHVNHHYYWLVDNNLQINFCNSVSIYICAIFMGNTFICVIILGTTNICVITMGTTHPRIISTFVMSIVNNLITSKRNSFTTVKSVNNCPKVAYCLSFFLWLILLYKYISL